MSVLSIRNLHKEYGKITAVNQLNLDIERGSVFGLLGPNGSGKTTTLGMILDVIKPTSGSYAWFEDGQGHEHRKRIGSILEKPNFYPNFSAVHNLKIACNIKGVDESRIDEVLEQVGLYERRDYAFRTFSLGMKQRLAIASALLSHPEVMILDEPTNGLDPEGIAEIRQLIIEIAQSGKTIILASHLLDEVQKICSRFAILKNGSLIHEGEVEANFGTEVIIEVGSDDLNQLAEVVQQFEAYKSHRLLKDKIEMKCEDGTGVADLNAFLMAHDIVPNHLSIVKKNLEQQFLEILSSNA